MGILHTLKILATPLKSVRWILACVGIQFVLFVMLATWKRLAPEGELPKRVIDRVFDVYGPGLDVVQSVLPDHWFSGGDAAPPILALGLVVVAYGIVLGLGITVGGALVRFVSRHALGRMGGVSRST